MPGEAPGIRPCPGAAALEAFALGAAGAADMAAHVAACPACRELVGEIRDNQSFLERAAPVLAHRSAAERRCAAPDEIEGYELHEEIGCGGQGVVFRAVQRATRRAAAVKILPGSALTAKRDRLRFEREVEIAASLRHPNLVTVFGSGETSRGHRFVAMEHVKGVPIDRFVTARYGEPSTGGRARVDAILRLVRVVAVGVGHAHSVGVIHRDLKPSNILVEADGTPRVLDFGLARPVGIDVNASMTQGFVGTPAYAAPEQLGPAPWTAGTRADVYSLGLVLYRLLTGEHPYPCDGSLVEVARHARSTEPPAPSRLVGRVPQDVDTIVLKCLAKEPERRYANGAALGSDIDDYLNLRPISARRDSTAYVLLRLAMKHRTVTVGAAVLLTTVVGAAIGLAMLARDLDVTRREAVGALAASEVLRARLMVGTGASGQAEQMLWMGVASEGMTIGPETITPDTSPMARRLWWGLMEALASNPCELRRDIGSQVRLAGVEDDGVVWAFSARGEYREWDAQGRVIGSYTPAGNDGDLCGASADRSLCVVRHTDHLDLVDVTRGRVIARRSWTLRVYPSYTTAEFSPDGTLVAIGTRSLANPITICDTSTFEPVHVIDEPVTAAVFLPASRGLPRLAVGVRDGTRGTVEVRQAPDWKVVFRAPLPSYHRHFMPPVTLVPLEDEEHVLVCGVHSLVLDLDLSTGEVTKLDCPATVVTAARRRREGRTAIGLTTGVTAMVDVGVQTVDRRIEGTGIISSLWMSPDRSRLLIGDTDGQLRLMDLRERPWLERMPSTPCTHADIAVASDGTVAWGDDMGTLHLQFGDGTRVTATGHSAEVVGVAFSPDGEEIATCGLDGAVLCWNRRGECTARLWQGRWAVWCVAYAGSSGRTVVAGDQRGVVRVWPETDRDRPREFTASRARIPRLAVSPDGRFVAVVGYGNASVWDLSSGTLAFNLIGHTNTSRAVAYSPDGTIIATGADDQTVRIWDARTGHSVRAIEGLAWGAYDLTFDPRGRVLAAVGPGQELAILDPWIGEELATFPVHEKHVFGAAFSPDGTRIYTCGKDFWIGVTNLHQISECIRGSADYWKDRLARSKAGAGR